MTRLISITLILLLMLTLFGCKDAPMDSAPSITSAAAATVETTIATQPPTVETIPPTTLPPETTMATEPEHSEFYIPDVSVEEVILYFKEVCLQAEFVNSGDPTRLQKWLFPIYYSVNGVYTDEDYKTLTDFTGLLNSIYGFPGIYETKDFHEANLDIYFCYEGEQISRLGENFRGMDGGVTFWYNNDVIHTGIICCRADIDQKLRNSVILEEVYNGLGPIQDTVFREDSIIWAEFSQPQNITAVDLLILRLLYHPLMQPGMDAQDCETVIRTLYY